MIDLMQRKLFVSLVLIASVTFACEAEAQLAIQQPIVERLQIGTTVSVPDRGGVYLGGVKRARDSRSTFGWLKPPFKPGSSLGFDREAVGVSVHAYIHDFEEMDRLLLEQAARQSRFGGSGSAELNLGPHTTSSLAASDMRRRFLSTSPSKPITTPSAASSPAIVAASSTSTGEASFQMGMKSLEAGKQGVALLHFRKAVRHGCTRAADMVSKLSSQRFRSQLAERR